MLLKYLITLNVIMIIECTFFGFKDLPFIVVYLILAHIFIRDYILNLVNLKLWKPYKLNSMRVEKSLLLFKRYNIIELNLGKRHLPFFTFSFPNILNSLEKIRALRRGFFNFSLGFNSSFLIRSPNLLNTVLEEIFITFKSFMLGGISEVCRGIVEKGLKGKIILNIYLILRFSILIYLSFVFLGYFITVLEVSNPEEVFTSLEVSKMTSIVINLIRTDVRTCFLVFFFQSIFLLGFYIVVFITDLYNCKRQYSIIIPNKSVRNFKGEENSLLEFISNCSEVLDSSIVAIEDSQLHQQEEVWGGLSVIKKPALLNSLGESNIVIETFLSIEIKETSVEILEYSMEFNINYRSLVIVDLYMLGFIYVGFFIILDRKDSISLKGACITLDLVTLLKDQICMVYENNPLIGILLDKLESFIGFEESRMEYLYEWDLFVETLIYIKLLAFSMDDHSLAIFIIRDLDRLLAFENTFRKYYSKGVNYSIYIFSTDLLDKLYINYLYAPSSGKYVASRLDFSLYVVGLRSQRSSLENPTFLEKLSLFSDNIYIFVPLEYKCFKNSFYQMVRYPTYLGSKGILYFNINYFRRVSLCYKYSLNHELIKTYHIHPSTRVHFKAYNMTMSGILRLGPTDEMVCRGMDISVRRHSLKRIPRNKNYKVKGSIIGYSDFIEAKRYFWAKNSEEHAEIFEDPELLGEPQGRPYVADFISTPHHSPEHGHLDWVTEMGDVRTSWCGTQLWIEESGKIHYLKPSWYRETASYSKFHINFRALFHNGWCARSFYSLEDSLVVRGVSVCGMGFETQCYCRRFGVQGMSYCLKVGVYNGVYRDIGGFLEFKYGKVLELESPLYVFGYRRVGRDYFFNNSIWLRLREKGKRLGGVRAPEGFDTEGIRGLRLGIFNHFKYPHTSRALVLGWVENSLSWGTPTYRFPSLSQLDGLISPTLSPFRIKYRNPVERKLSSKPVKTYKSLLFGKSFKK